MNAPVGALHRCSSHSLIRFQIGERQGHKTATAGRRGAHGVGAQHLWVEKVPGCDLHLRRSKITDLRLADALEATMTGTIRTLRVDKGFGFIKDDAGKEYFFHQSAVYGEGLDNLREGDSVEFDVGQGPKGPRAENVRRTST